MKFSTITFHIILWTLLAQIFLPWWILGVTCAVICYFKDPSRWIAFAASFTGVFLLWVVRAFMADYNFDVPMSSLLAGLLGNIPVPGVFLITGLTGGIVGGLSGWIGAWFRRLVVAS